MARRSSAPSTFLARLAECGSASDAVWAAGMLIGIVFTLIAAYRFPYPDSPSGKFWAYAGLWVRASLYLWAGDALARRGGLVLARLLAMGLVAGVGELLVDWWLIHGVAHGRLVYLTGNDIVLLGSPIWMPLAWACVIVELGYPALRIFAALRARIGERVAAIAASLICATSAGITVGFYEYFAYRAGWWKYEPARRMLGGFCALYIPLGEFLMFLVLLPIAQRAIADDQRPRAAAIEAGAMFAVAIALGYALAYALLER